MTIDFLNSSSQEGFFARLCGIEVRRNTELKLMNTMPQSVELPTVLDENLLVVYEITTGRCECCSIRCGNAPERR